MQHCNTSPSLHSGCPRMYHSERVGGVLVGAYVERQRLRGSSKERSLDWAAASRARLSGYRLS